MNTTMVRVGVPVTGGSLVRAAKERQYPVLFSANAFATTYPKGHTREGSFKGFRLPTSGRYEGMDVALDSAGFVAAAHYGDYRWTVADYFDLVQSHTWSWYASMDYCCEPDIAKDRPLRLLRIAATAVMLHQCNEEARRRGLRAPMPVLQGWTPEEYVQCAQWLPLSEWPDLIGIGSVCRRNLQGHEGILSILEALETVLPHHVRYHLFGVKSSALEVLANHPRVVSVDSMAWDMQARMQRRIGRDTAYRIGHMEDWVSKQQIIASRSTSRPYQQIALFDPIVLGPLSSFEEVALETLALHYSRMIMDGQVDYIDAVHHCHMDGITILAILRNEGLNEESLSSLDDVVGGISSPLRNAIDGYFKENYGRQ